MVGISRCLRLLRSGAYPEGSDSSLLPRMVCCQASHAVRQIRAFATIATAGPPPRSLPNVGLGVENLAIDDKEVLGVLEESLEVRAAEEPFTTHHQYDACRRL
jgi:hypothetical protein